MDAAGAVYYPYLLQMHPFANWIAKYVPHLITAFQGYFDPII